MSIDWLRLRGSEKCREKAQGILARFFGDSEPASGRHFYGQRERFEGGAELWWDMHRPDAIVDVPGSSLGTLEAWEVIELTRALIGVGFCQATRLDVALDYIGSELRLVHCVESSCVAGELVGSRTYETFKQGDGRKGYAVRIGRRGKHGSGRFVRCYDKGLETQERGANEWHRFEVEFSKGAAAFALGWIMQGQMLQEYPDRHPLLQIVGVKPQPGWAASALQIVAGAVDFRVANGKKHLRSRPRCDWWADLIEGINPKRVKFRRPRFFSLDRTRQWLEKAVWPTLKGCMKVTGSVSITDTVRRLSADFEAIPERVTRAVYEFGASFSSA